MSENNPNPRLIRRAEIATKIIADISAEVKNGTPADKALARLFRDHREYGSRDRRFYSDTLFAYFRWHGWTSKAAPDTLPVRAALSIALDNSVSEQTRSDWQILEVIEQALFDQLLGADLESQRSDLASASSVELHLEDLVPEWCSDKMSHIDFNAFIENTQKRPPTWLHIPHDQQKAFSECLSAQQVTFRQHPVLSSAFAIEQPVNMHQIERAFGRPVQIQDLASQAVVAACSAQPGQRWWDTCCASGGKAIGLAQSVGDSGKIFATDIRKSILRNLERRVRAHNITIISSAEMDTTDPAVEAGMFDGILIDAPCSGTGTWSRNPDARWRTPQEALNELTEIQAALISNMAHRVHRGGKLVYSVCSLIESEGPQIISEFLNDHVDFETAELPHPLTGQSTQGEITVMPDEGPCDGMYLAVLQKKAL